tara:strand:- start:43 stop:384 length:342 start_codon:yes stop_codon:yes gene_type:complete
MKLSNNQKKQRVIGAIVGAVLPVVTLLIANYVLLQYYPITIDEFGLIRVQKDYTAFLWENIAEAGKYAVFFCLSINMPLVMLLSQRKLLLVANGVVIPTVIYSVVLVYLRILL